MAFNDLYLYDPGEYSINCIIDKNSTPIIG